MKGNGRAVGLVGLRNGAAEANLSGGGICEASWSFGIRGMDMRQGSVKGVSPNCHGETKTGA